METVRQERKEQRAAKEKGSPDKKKVLDWLPKLAGSDHQVDIYKEEHMRLANERFWSPDTSALQIFQSFDTKIRCHTSNYAKFILLDIFSACVVICSQNFCAIILLQIGINVDYFASTLFSITHLQKTTLANASTNLLVRTRHGGFAIRQKYHQR
jgi:hypothetical protein